MTLAEMMNEINALGRNIRAAADRLMADAADNTHDMQDIDALCSRVLLIGKGQLLLDGTTAQIRCLAGENLSTEESVADLYRRFGI